MHHGKGFGSGHYTAYCYNTEGGEEESWPRSTYEALLFCHIFNLFYFVFASSGFWVHCNDSEMKVCSVEEVCNTQAYILFYTQRSA